MISNPSPGATTLTLPGIHHAVVRIRTRQPLEFVDLTERIGAIVRRSRVTDGFVNVQTRHTTTAIVVNEHEPLLIEDLKDLLRRVAPRRGTYRHDDMRIRTVNLTPGERPNGHAHARAMLLGTSETLNVIGGELQLGRWQRVFLVEADGGRERTVSVGVVGAVAVSDTGRPALRTRRATAVA